MRPSKWIVVLGAISFAFAADSRDSARLSERIEKFREQLAARDLGYVLTAKSLYQGVLGPVGAALMSKKRIVIVPDGMLWNLPFQALIAPNGQHLIEQSALFYGPSLTAAFEMHKLSAPLAAFPTGRIGPRAPGTFSAMARPLSKGA